MLHARLMRDYLERCDVAGVRKLWAALAPHLPQPANDYETMVMIHRARTEAATVSMRQRAYSHQWLLANGLPSGLPPRLRPRAERMDFAFAFGVGIGLKSCGVGEKRQLGASLQQAMGSAVEAAFAEGETRPAKLRERMAEARARVLRQAGGPRVTVRVSFDFESLQAMDDVRSRGLC